MFRMTPTNIGWLLAYLAMLIAIVVGMRGYRNYAITTYGTTEAGAKWDDWRTAVEEMGDDGPVSRRTPKSSEPPPLVLMRDHYSSCLGISLLLSSCLFGWLMICVRGVMRPVQLNVDDD